MIDNDQINEYYDFSKLDYQLYNLRRRNLSMHYGLWDESVRSHREALDREHEVLAEAAGITAGDRVLDLGCGYGAGAVWLAEHVGCRVLGVNISAAQVESARVLAHHRGVDGLATFLVADFHATTISREAVDVVWALESLSHSDRKAVALAEAWRVLKPGGRLVIADGFFARPPRTLSQREEAVARSCFEGTSVPPLDTLEAFVIRLRRAGFSSIKTQLVTDQILPTARRVRRLGWILMPVARFARALGLPFLRPAHMRAFIDQYEAFASGLGVYTVISATKV